VANGYWLAHRDDSEDEPRTTLPPSDCGTLGKAGSDRVRCLPKAPRRPSTGAAP